MTLFEALDSAMLEASLALDFRANKILFLLNSRKILEYKA